MYLYGVPVKNKFNPRKECIASIMDCDGQYFHVTKDDKIVCGDIEEMFIIHPINSMKGKKVHIMSAKSKAKMYADSNGKLTCNFGDYNSDGHIFEMIECENGRWKIKTVHDTYLSSSNNLYFSQSFVICRDDNGFGREQFQIILLD